MEVLYIALLGGASILVGPNTRMTFVDNSAKGHGGAIYNRYISAERLMSTAACFIRYTEPLIEPDNWTAQFNFSGNSAHFGGCSIYTSSIVPCTWKNGKTSNVFRWKNWNYDTTCRQGIEISTEPGHFIGINTSNNRSISDSIEIYPGNAFRIPLSAHDDLGNNNIITNDTSYYAELQDPNSVVADIEEGYSNLHYFQLYEH
jgi:predicted outer membrane repeat protein